jgi:hypothetical protein
MPKVSTKALRSRPGTGARSAKPDPPDGRTLDPTRAARQATRAGQRPVIAVRGGGLSRQATAGEGAILSAGAPVYQRGQSLVRPILEEVDAADGRRTSVAQLARIELPYMRDLLCRSAVWRKFDRRRAANVPVDPPAAVAQVILRVARITARALAIATARRVSRSQVERGGGVVSGGCLKILQLYAPSWGPIFRRRWVGRCRRRVGLRIHGRATGAAIRVFGYISLLLVPHAWLEDRATQGRVQLARHAQFLGR